MSASRDSPEPGGQSDLAAAGRFAGVQSGNGNLQFNLFGPLDAFMGMAVKRSMGTFSREVLPRQIPDPPSPFIGRQAELEDLIANFRIGHGVTRVNIHGMPGSGKSALAHQLAMLASREFPGPHLYFDLRAHSAQSGSTAELLGAALLALGLAQDELPPGAALRAAQYRTLLNDRRSIVVIDNVVDSVAAESLMPLRTGALVVTTSYAKLTDVSIQKFVGLETFTNSEAREYLASWVNDGTLRGSEVDVSALLALSGRLPVALRICAALMNKHGEWGWHDLLERLRDAAGSPRLDALRAGRFALREVFLAAYLELDVASRLAFRNLGAIQETTLRRDLCEALASDNKSEGRSAVDELIDHGLLQARSAKTLEIHSLLLAQAQELFRDCRSEDAAGVTERLESWSQVQLGTTYKSMLTRSLSKTPVFVSIDQVESVDLDAVALDVPALFEGKSAMLEEFANDYPYLLLESGGGAGKTVALQRFALRFCRPELGDSRIPLLVYARDYRNSLLNAEPEAHAGQSDSRGRRVGDPVDILMFLQRSLVFRHDFWLPLAALRQALDRLNVILIVDGVDELFDPVVRNGFLSSLSQFQFDHPNTRVVVSARPGTVVGGGATGFRRVTLAPWDRVQESMYLRRLVDVGLVRVSSGGFVPVNRVPVRVEGIVPSPLTTQFAVAAPTLDSGPASFIDAILGRELARLTSREETSSQVSDPADPGGQRSSVSGREAGRMIILKSLTEALAFRMQSDTQDRMSISVDDLRHFVSETSHSMRMSFSTEELIEFLTSRTQFLLSSGSSLTFAHTWFREYLAASFLARSDPRALGRLCASAAFSDSSWVAVGQQCVQLVEARLGGVYLARYLSFACEAGLSKDVLNVLRNVRDASDG